MDVEEKNKTFSYNFFSLFNGAFLIILKKMAKQFIYFPTFMKMCFVSIQDFCFKMHCCCQKKRLLLLLCTLKSDLVRVSGGQVFAGAPFTKQGCFRYFLSKQCTNRGHFAVVVYSYRQKVLAAKEEKS